MTTSQLNRKTERVSITNARNTLTKLPEKLEQDPAIIEVTRQNIPVLAILNWEDWEAIVETLEILADPEAMEQLRQSIADIEAGRVQDLGELGKELGLD